MVYHIPILPLPSQISKIEVLTPGFPGQEKIAAEKNVPIISGFRPLFMGPEMEDLETGNRSISDFRPETHLLCNMELEIG